MVPQGRPDREVWDAQHVRQAQELARRNQGWVVMWSSWRRAFTAFACFTAEPVVLDEPAVPVLLAHMRQTELTYAAAPIPPFQGKAL